MSSPSPLFQERFFCDAQDGAMWKVIVDNARDINSQITITILRRSMPSLVKIVYGTRQLLLEAIASEGGCGYPLTSNGRDDLRAELCRIFLS